MTVQADIVAALKAELAGDDVLFHEVIPGKLFPPSVIVTPGDVFIEPSTMGLVQENWEILVCMNRNAPDRGVSKMRDMSMRIRRAVSTVGAVWDGTSGPRLVEGEADYVLMVNQIYFKYDPATGIL